MRVRAVRKEKSGDLDTADWVDRTRDPYAEGDTLWVPVIASEPCDREIPERQRYRGRGYYMIGDIAVLHGEEPTRTRDRGYCRVSSPARDPVDQIPAGHNTDTRDEDCLGERRGSLP